MRIPNVRPCLAGAAVTALFATTGGAAAAQTATTYKQVTFKAQDVKMKHLTTSVSMTKDEESPARAFTAPSSMAVNPENPRVIATATANMRNKTCFLSVSTDAGATWHFSKEVPGAGAYPYCTNTSAAVPEVSLAWGRNGVLYYGRQAYGDGEGPREGKSSIMLARTSDLGSTWKVTMVEDNRSSPPPTPASATSWAGSAS
jgi:Neuraminidase (sialidase)